MTEHPMTDRTPARVARAYVDTPHGQIHYRRAGEAGPAVVLFHESPLSSREFERALPLLGQRVRAFALDTPGYGESDAPPGPIAFAEYATRLLAAVDALGLDRFAAAGVHTGASAALDISLRAPQRISHLVLSGTPLIPPDLAARLRANWLAPRVAHDGSHLLDVWRGRLASWGEDAPDELLQWGAVDLLRVYERHLWALDSVFDYDPRPALAALHCPVLFLNAEGDSLAPADRTAAAMVAGASLDLVAGVRGQLPWRAPERYADAVLRFIGA